MAELKELGEDAIVNGLIGLYLGSSVSPVELGVGDDAAIIRPTGRGRDFVVTVDACPTPVVDLLGLGSYYDWGRMAGVISLSDIAAMGGEPVAFLSATSMPTDMTVDDYEAYLSGLHDICEEWSTPIVGGNIREAMSFAAVTVAIGSVPAGQAFLRSTANLGDDLVVVGESGVFWSAVLDVLGGGDKNELSASQRRALFRPVPRLAEARLLRSTSAVTGALDCSDGLGGAIETLCSASGLGALIDFEAFAIDDCVRSAAAAHDVPIHKLLLAWGDWQLLTAIDPRQTPSVLNLMAQNGYAASHIGTLTEAPDISAMNVRAKHSDSLPDLMASKRFEPSSYLAVGLHAYVSRLKEK